MSTGWRYSVQVPDFTKEERHGEEIVVYYQVDVLVQAPGTNEPAPPTTVWRRYSEFRQLHANLKGAFPELFKKKELEPPSKRALRFVNNNDRLLHERRQKLETWLWNLLSYSDIAHSRFMKLFLQLNLAVRGATATSSVAMSLRDANEDDEQLDTSSELSVPSGTTNLSHPMTDVLTPGTARYSTKTESLDAYRMGLRVEQRRELKHLVHVISTSLEKVSQEAQEVRGENSNLQQENRSLEEQVASLNQIIKDGKYTQVEQHEELCKSIEEKEATLKKTTETVARLETSLKESKRQCEALESEIRSIRQESATALEKQLAEASVLESKLQAQAVAQARLDKAMFETKQKARQDNRLLAETVRTLTSEKASNLENLKEQERKLKEMETLKKRQSELENEKQESQQRIGQLQSEMATMKQALRQRVKEVEEKSDTDLVALKEEHHEKQGALKATITELEKRTSDVEQARKEWLKEKRDLEMELSSVRESVRDDDGMLRLVLSVDAPAGESVHPSDAEMSAIRAELEQTKKENRELKEALSLVKESAALEDTNPPNGVHVEDSDVPNLEGLMITIQQLQEQNKSLQDEVGRSSADTDLSALREFSEWTNGLYQELRECATSGGGIEAPITADEAGSIIEKVADSNGKLQLLTVQIQDAKKDFQRKQHIPESLLTSVTRLMSDFIQKCSEINEMKIDTLLSRSVTQPPPVSTEGTSAATTSQGKCPPSKLVDSNAVQEDASPQTATPSVKMFLGGIQAKMSQGSQGFMSFMQRGATPPMPTDSDQVALTRRADQQ